MIWDTGFHEEIPAVGSRLNPLWTGCVGCSCSCDCICGCPEDTVDSLHSEAIDCSTAKNESRTSSVDRHTA
jgi:hypothetical protein